MCTRTPTWAKYTAVRAGFPPAEPVSLPPPASSPPSSSTQKVNPHPPLLHPFKFFAAREDLIALVERASKPATPTFLSALRAAHPFWLRLAALWGGQSWPQPALAGSLALR